MFGWFAKREARSFTSRIVSAAVDSAEGTGTAAPTETAALEAAASLYAGCFAAARLDPPVPALTATVRALMARNLIRSGQDYHEIEVRRGGHVVLVPVGYAYPYSGSPAEMEWVYQSSVYTP